MITQYRPQLEALAPDSGCYLSEGNWRQPNFQHAFYRSNYDPLNAIKAKYDPHDLFYAVTAVGSDRWRVSNHGHLRKI